MDKQVNGVVTSIGFGGIFVGTYGETAPCMVTINEEVYSCFVKPYNGHCKLQVKKGESYVDIKEGMHVVFDATSNTKEDKTYWNFKSSGITILATEATPQPPQPTNSVAPSSNTTQQQKEPVSDDKELTDKFCDGLAAFIAAYKFKGKEKPSEDKIERVSNYIKKIFG